MNYVSVKGLSKRFTDQLVLDQIDFEIPRGSVVGLIGPNGAGKTTTLKAMLGLTDHEGSIDVLGFSPRSERHKMMQHLGFISDVGVLPRWMKVSELLDFTAGVHLNFDRGKADAILATTQIRSNATIKTLSKGMVTQLHLALVLAMDAKLLILDEPTLGLDIVYRSEFYQRILDDFLRQDQSLLISTHQVEEIEHLLTHLLFIDHGRICLNASMDDVFDRFLAVEVPSEQVDAAIKLEPISEQSGLGGSVMIFDGVSREHLEAIGLVRAVRVAELFVVMVQRDEKSKM